MNAPLLSSLARQKIQKTQWVQQESIQQIFDYLQHGGENTPKILELFETARYRRNAQNEFENKL